MKKKSILALAAAAALAVSLAGCTSTEDSIKTLVDGNIASIYLDQQNEDYLTLTGQTADEAHQAYEDGIDVEAEYFCNYFGITDSSLGETYDDFVTDDIKTEIRDLYKEIYSHTQYTVGDVTKLSDGSYTVQVTVSPINIMDLATTAVENGTDNAYTQFVESAASLDVSSMTEEEYVQYSMDYAQACIDLVEEQMANIGYEDDKTQSIQVQKDSDGLYRMNDDDWSIFDSYVIYYP